MLKLILKRTLSICSFVDSVPQEAYELAVQGPVRPNLKGCGRPPLIYGLRCVKYDSPNLELEFTCLNESEDFFKSLVSELGFRLRTGAVCSQIRCIRYGFFDLEHALLVKQCGLESVLNNIYAVGMISKANGNFKAKSSHFRKPIAPSEFEKMISEGDLDDPHVS